MTVRADLPVILDAALAARAERQIFQGLQKSFFFEGSLVFFFQGPRRTQNQVDQNPWQIEDSYQQCSEGLYQRVAGARANVAIGPDNKRDPERDKEGSTEARQYQDEIAYKRGIKSH